MADIITNTIQVDGFDALQDNLARLTFTQESEVMKRAISILNKSMKDAKKNAQQHLASEIPNNQRHAEKAVRSHVYSRKSGVLGGNITILRSRKHRNGHSTPREIPPTKSGREREWSERTKKLWGYQGTDAQFILWFLTVGTRERKSGIGRSNRHGEYNSNSFSRARSNYFGGTHNVGRIDPDKINPQLLAILQRVVDGEIIPEIDKLIAEIAK